MERSSNRDRIARAAEEARLAEAEKAAKKAARGSQGSRSKAGSNSVRMKVIWAVCSDTGRTVKSFPYPDQSAAEAHAKALTKSTGRTHVVRATKVPME